MSETLPGDEPRETVVDSRLDPRRRATKARRIGLVMAILATLVTAAIGAWIFLRIEASADATKHVPANALVAARVDLRALARFPPAKKHLLAKGDADDKLAARAKKLAKATDVNVLLDLREVVVAAIDGVSWVAIVGGRIKPGRFVAGLEKVAAEEKWSGWARDGELFVGPDLVVAQAEDGAILFGSDRAIVSAALPFSDEARKTDLPPKGDVTFAVVHDALAAFGDKSPSSRALAELEAARGTLSLGDAPELVVKLTPSKSGAASELAPKLEAALTELAALAPDESGEAEALRAAKLKVDGDVIVVTSPWPLAGLERLCTSIAHRLE